MSSGAASYDTSASNELDVIDLVEIDRHLLASRRLDSFERLASCASHQPFWEYDVLAPAPEDSDPAPIDDGAF
jgi:hypothetical protein